MRSKCKFYGRKCNSNQKWNNKNVDVSVKDIIHVKKNYIWNPAACSCVNDKYLSSIIDDSAITCDEIIDAEKTKTVTVSFNEKKVQSVKQKVFVFYLPF